MRCENQFCKKVLKLRPGQNKLNPKRRFCDYKCQTRELSLKVHYKNYIKNKKYTEEKKKKFREWYQKNKEKQFENIKRNYEKNKVQWRERKYVDKHKEKIWVIIGRICKECGGEADEVNHLTYDFPARGCTVRGERLLEYIKWYCTFLEPLCMPCHRAKKKGKYILK